MTISRFAKLGWVAASLAVSGLTIGGCATTAQYTSGQDYLSRYQTSATVSPASGIGTDADGIKLTEMRATTPDK